MRTVTSGTQTDLSSVNSIAVQTSMTEYMITSEGKKQIEDVNKPLKCFQVEMKNFQDVLQKTTADRKHDVLIDQVEFQGEDGSNYQMEIKDRSDAFKRKYLGFRNPDEEEKEVAKEYSNICME